MNNVIHQQLELLSTGTTGDAGESGTGGETVDAAVRLRVRQHEGGARIFEVSIALLDDLCENPAVTAKGPSADSALEVAFARLLGSAERSVYVGTLLKLRALAIQKFFL